MTSTLSIGTVLASPTSSYRIERVLGQGSFGITYLASTQMEGPLGRITVQVALKEFFMGEVNGREGSTVTTGSQDGLFHKYKAKFVKEAQNLSRLHHESIIRVLETFEANNTVYYSMEYLDGGTLDDLIKVRGWLAEGEALPIARRVAEVLHYMHSRGMLHLDLKPANIMLRSGGEPVLIDFGLAKQFDDEGNPESSTTIGGGTPGYAPIEQSNYKGHEPGTPLPATMDVYALGATLFKMLTGKRPPVASELMEDGFPRGEVAHVSAPVAGLLERAMTPSRKQRIPDMAAFVRELSGGAPLPAAARPAAHSVAKAEATTFADEPAPKPAAAATKEVGKGSEGKRAPAPKPKSKKKLWWMWSLLGLSAMVLIIWIIYYLRLDNILPKARDNILPKGTYKSCGVRRCA